MRRDKTTKCTVINDVLFILFLFILFFITAFGQSPSPCSKNNCHPMAICYETASNSYDCKCIVGHRDMAPENSGRKCVSMLGFNECAREEDNDCSENAKCIDVDFEYKCECLSGYRDASPKGTVPGSNCVPIISHKRPKFLKK